MIIFLFMTLTYLSVMVYNEYRQVGEPDAYQKWLKEPTDLEIVECG